MATDPAFGNTIKVGSAVLGGFDASFTAPSTTSTLLTGVTAGTQIEEIVVQGLATLAVGIVNIWLHDGSTYHLYDQVTLTVAPSASTSVAAFRQVTRYGDLYLPSSSWTLRVSHTTTGNDTSKLSVTATGWDFT